MDHKTHTITCYKAKCETCSFEVDGLSSLPEAIESANDHINDYTENDGYHNLWHKVRITDYLLVEADR